jgi:hypothetical protein
MKKKTTFQTEMRAANEGLYKQGSFTIETLFKVKKAFGFPLLLH